MTLAIYKYRYYLYIPVLMASFIAGNAIVDIAGVLSAILWIIFYQKDFKNLNNYFKNFIILISIFYLSMISSSFFSDYFNYSFLKSIVFVRFIIFSLFLYSFYSINIKNFKNYLLSILIVLIFLYFDSLIQFIFGIDLFGFQTLSNSYRISGPFKDELILGYFVFVFSSIITLNTTKFNLLYFLFLLISFAVILLTGERVALIKFSLFHIIFFIYVISKKKTKINFKLIYSFIAISIFVTFLLLQFNQLERHKQFVSKFFPGSAEFIMYSGHYSHFVSSILVFRDNPISGSGFRSFRLACKNNKDYFNKDNVYDINSVPDINNNRVNIIKSMNNNLCSTHPHNFYLEILSELGLLGFISFMIMLIYIFKKIYFFDLRLFFLLYFFPLLSSPSLFHQKNSFLLVFVIVIMFLIRDYRKNN